MQTSVASKEGLDPSNLLKLGELMTRDGEFQKLSEAKRLLEIANETKPQNAEILVALGRVNEKDQDLDKARQYY